VTQFERQDATDLAMSSDGLLRFARNDNQPSKRCAEEQSDYGTLIENPGMSLR
jgi:hypothetical protein